MILGVIVILAAGVLLGMSWVNLGRIYAVASSMRSTEFFNNPFPQVALTAGLAALGGLLLGAGLGFLGRGPKKVEPTANKPAPVQPVSQTDVNRLEMG